MSARMLRRSTAVLTIVTFALLGGCGGSGGGGYGGDAPPTQPATPPPPAPPTIGIAALPSNTVNRTTTLTAEATAAAGITRVEFLVDGTVIGTTTSAPYTFAWDTSAAADGAHAITARITDANNT